MKKITTIYVAFMLYCIHAISQPIITSFSPSSASIGATITISGNNFSTTPFDNIVRFGNVTGSIVSATTTSLSVTIPKGASYGQITVSVNNLTCYSSGYFTPSSNCNNGSVSFGNKKDSVFYKANSFVARDFDGDGKIDMANIFDSLYIKLNTSNPGTYSTATIKSFNKIGANAIYLTDGDINGDGKLDILSAKGDTIFILKNESTPGNISFSKMYFTSSFQAGKAAIADMDGDGKLDIIISNSNLNDSVIAIFKNIGSNGNISFGVEQDFNTSIHGIENLKVGDIDGDNKPDIVLSAYHWELWVIKNSTLNNVITFDTSTLIMSYNSLINSQIGTIQIQIMMYRIIEIELGDINEDGKTDLVIGFEGYDFETIVNGVCVLRNTRTSNNISFDVPQLAGNGDETWNGNGQQGAFFYDFAIADIDGNSKPDIVYLTSSYQYSITNSYYQFHTVLNNCTIDSISFQDLIPNYNRYFPSKSYTIQLADMEGDGFPDLVCGNQIFFGACLLPVTLIDFSAKPLDNEIALKWKTATEINNSHFTIQKSVNGYPFSNIGSVKAIGSGANSYEFTDKNPTNGINYYRLQTIDKDGSSNYSKVVSVNFSNNQAFSIIPNPARDFTNIQFSQTVEKATILVYDINGKAVLSQSLSNANGFKLNTQSLINGVYEIKINTSNGSFNEKLLINK